MLRTILAATLFLAGIASASEDSGFQFGGGVGRASIDGAAFGVPADSDSTAWKAFVGYRINKYVAAEFAYLDGARASDTIQGNDVHLSAHALQASVIGSYPFNEYLSAYGRLGLISWDATGTAAGPVVFGSVKDSGNDLSYGAGVAAKIEGALLRLEYEAAKLEEAKFKFISLSIAWLF